MLGDYGRPGRQLVKFHRGLIMSFIQNDILVNMLKKSVIFLGLIAGYAHFQLLKNFEIIANAANFSKRIFGAFTVIFAPTVSYFTIATLLMPAKKCRGFLQETQIIFSDISAYIHLVCKVELSITYSQCQSRFRYPCLLL